MGLLTTQLPMEAYRKITLPYTSVFSSGTIDLTAYPANNYYILTAPVSTSINVGTILFDNKTPNPITIQTGTNLNITFQGVSPLVAIPNQIVLTDSKPFKLEGAHGDWLSFDRRSGVFYQRDAMTYNSPVSTISGVGLTDTTYALFMADIGSWQEGVWYRITDFATVYQHRNATDLNWTTVTGTTSPICVFTTSNQTIAPISYQEMYPYDVVYYDINEIGFTDLSNTERGRILRRHDTLNNIDLPYDWREQQHRRWETALGSGIYRLPTYPGGGEASILTDTIDITCYNIVQERPSDTWISANPNIGHTCNNVFGASTNNIIMHAESNRLNFSGSCKDIDITGITTNTVINASNNLYISGSNSNLTILNSNNSNFISCSNASFDTDNNNTFDSVATSAQLNNLTRCFIKGYTDSANIAIQTDREYVKNVRSTLLYSDTTAAIITGGDTIDLSAAPWAGEIRINSGIVISYDIQYIVGTQTHEIKILPDTEITLNFQGTLVSNVSSPTEIVLASNVLNILGANRDWVIFKKLDTPIAWYQIDTQQYL